MLTRGLSHYITQPHWKPGHHPKGQQLQPPNSQCVCSLGLALGAIDGNDSRGVVDSIILGLEDADQVGHDLLGGSNADFGALHDLDFNAEDTSAEFDVADGNIDEVDLGLTGGDLVTSGVLLSLCALATDLSRDDDLATDGTTTAHDGTNAVVGSVTDGETVE